MSEIELDIRNVGSSCTQHPVIVLANKLSEMGDKIKNLKLYFKSRDIPPPVLKLYLSRYGFEIVELGYLNSDSMYARAVKKV
ncbi:hypothetical protein [Pseudothermotoga thermarum]|uniref:Uncharacterized protein n=1 Tax=Pseudothermotoga thermarum DSM 5069 TaxID=688269 RepID=F7YTU3_9THEM|nr:hypothetical protein [Pseudothermotoga thermarum]AEH51388.1 hypothetical protein Theth_1321 [Pseudothermotoga thermarum DSM 5069]